MEAAVYDVLIAIETEGRRRETIGWEAQNANEIFVDVVWMWEEEELLLCLCSDARRDDNVWAGNLPAGGVFGCHIGTGTTRWMHHDAEEPVQKSSVSSGELEFALGEIQ